jgi:hypothetical protein
MQRSRGRRPVLLVAAVALAGGLALTTAACSTPPQAAAVTRTAPATAPASAAGSGAMLAECGVASVARSIAGNALVDRRAGRLTAGEYSAVLNTVAPTLLWRPHGLPKAVRAHAEALDAVVGPVTAGHDGPAFDPDGQAFLSAFGALAKDCDAAGTPVGMLATSGG